MSVGCVIHFPTHAVLPMIYTVLMVPIAMYDSPQTTCTVVPCVSWTTASRHHELLHRWCQGLVYIVWYGYVCRRAQHDTYTRYEYTVGLSKYSTIWCTTSITICTGVDVPSREHCMSRHVHQLTVVVPGVLLSHVCHEPLLARMSGYMSIHMVLLGMLTEVVVL